MGKRGKKDRGGNLGGRWRERPLQRAVVERRRRRMEGRFQKAVPYVRLYERMGGRGTTAMREEARQAKQAMRALKMQWKIGFSRGSVSNGFPETVSGEVPGNRFFFSSKSP